MLTLTRRFLFAGLAALGLTAVSRRAIAQVGSGGTGISGSAPIGSADVVIGTVTLHRTGEQPATLDSAARLLQGDQIDTADGAEAHILFDDGGYLAVRPNSSVKVNRYVVTGEATDVAAITLLKGALRSVTGWIGKLDPALYLISAGTATIGVLGTDHEVVLVRPQDGVADAEPGVHNLVNDGKTLVRSGGRAVEVDQGSAAYAPRGAAPRLHASVPAFFNRFHTPQEARVESHSRNVQQQIEGRLRQLGKLDPNERFEQYRQRVQSGRLRGGERRGAPNERTPGARTPAQEHQEQRAAARQQRRRERGLRKGNIER